MTMKLSKNERNTLDLIHTPIEGELVKFRFALELVNKGLVEMADTTIDGLPTLTFTITQAGKDWLMGQEIFDPYDYCNSPSIRDSAQVTFSGDRTGMYYEILRDDRGRTTRYNIVKITPASMGRLSRLLWGRDWPMVTSDKECMIWRVY